MVTILGVGAVGVDYIAEIASYPKEDEKIRTIASSIVGGGNCGNTITCLARLKINVAILSKWGNDANGKLVESELDAENIDYSSSIVCNKSSTGFTYILVSRDTMTRTCIHTPLTHDILLAEIDGFLASSSILSKHSLVHFDSRHTEAALAIAQQAKALHIPLSIDCEKDRPPYLDQLLHLADYIFTNEHFCRNYLSKYGPRPTSARELEVLSQTNMYEIQTDIQAIEAMISLYEYLGSTSSYQPKLIVSTMGSHGSLLLCPEEREKNSFLTTSHILNALIRDKIGNAPISLSRSIVRRSDSFLSYCVIRYGKNNTSIIRLSE
jgi:sugar/nucleoside kinase (ribokinase family)